MKIVKSILGGIVDLLMLVIIICAIGVTLISLTSDNNNVSKIGKYIPLNVMTNSMEPTIMEGDFIIMEECNVDDLKIGDVISFFAREQDVTIIKTHRIVAVDTSSGFKAFTTRGDNNEVDDLIPVFASDVVGIWTGIRLYKVGTVLNFVSSQTGFLICIVLPLLILFIYQIYKFVVVVIEERNAAHAKNEADILAAAERIKEKNKQKELEQDKSKKESIVLEEEKSNQTDDIKEENNEKENK